MIVGTKRDIVMRPQSLADIEKCGFKYIGSLCTKVDEDFKFLPEAYVESFFAKVIGHAYCINFGRTHDEPNWARGEGNIENIDIFVKRKEGK